jgi:multicomponent Na+:H+ antiporter subunit F
VRLAIEIVARLDHLSFRCGQCGRRRPQRVLFIHRIERRQNLVGYDPVADVGGSGQDAPANAAGFILLTVAAGLVRVLRGPGDFDRMMGVQLLGTGGIPSLLLIASATTVAGVEDVALGLALLAAFTSIAFVNNAETDGPEPLEGEDG